MNQVYYGIIPPGMTVTTDNLLRQGLDKILLFDTMTAAIEYLETQAKVNKTYYKIVNVEINILPLDYSGE